jgi:hypothetical protein
VLVPRTAVRGTKHSKLDPNRQSSWVAQNLEKGDQSGDRRISHHPYSTLLVSSSLRLHRDRLTPVVCGSMQALFPGGVCPE